MYVRDSFTILCKKKEAKVHEHIQFDHGLTLISFESVYTFEEEGEEA